MCAGSRPVCICLYRQVRQALGCPAIGRALTRLYIQVYTCSGRCDRPHRRIRRNNSSQFFLNLLPLRPMPSRRHPLPQNPVSPEHPRIKLRPLPPTPPSSVSATPLRQVTVHPIPTRQNSRPKRAKSHEAPRTSKPPKPTTATENSPTAQPQKLQQQRRRRHPPRTRPQRQPAQSLKPRPQKNRATTPFLPVRRPPKPCCKATTRLTFPFR